MTPLIIGSFEDFEKHSGQELGASDFFSKSPNPKSTSLPMRPMIISGFIQILNGPNLRGPLGIPLPMAT